MVALRVRKLAEALTYDKLCKNIYEKSSTIIIVGLSNSPIRSI